MELWIRSQDRESLLKVEKIFYFNTCSEMESTGRNVILNKEWIGEKNCIELGEYKTKERALEVLDEISNKIKNQFIVEVNGLLRPEDISAEQKRLEYLYTGEFIMQDPMYEIKPINTNVVYYEMPKE